MTNFSLHKAVIVDLLSSVYRHHYTSQHCGIGARCSGVWQLNSCPFEGLYVRLMKYGLRIYT